MKKAKSIFPNQEDNDVNDKFLNSLNNFNLFDIILRVSALNLLPYNQNKSLVLDKIINDILTYGFDSYNSENLMSMSRFRNLINQYMNSGLALSIDPAEMPFIQRVQFYGDYWILTGINTKLSERNISLLTNVSRVQNISLLLNGLNLCATGVGFAIIFKKLDKESNKLSRQINRLQSIVKQSQDIHNEAMFNFNVGSRVGTY